MSSYQNAEISASLSKISDSFMEEENKVLEIEIPVNADKQSLLLIQYIAPDGGGQGEDTSLSDYELSQEIRKCAICGRFADEFKGTISGDAYFLFKSCFRWFCPTCGKVHREIEQTGRLHKRRYTNLVKRLGDLNQVSLRQYVFTLPYEVREKFLTRSAILSFKKMSLKVVRKMHPERPVIAYFHAFGDKQDGYHPHWNFHVIEPRGTVLGGVDLDKVKALFKKALYAYLAVYGVRGDWSLNVHYSFAPVTGKIIHRLRYMCRPHPNAADVDYIMENKFLWRFFVVEMKGFSYLTSYGDLKQYNHVDADFNVEELEEMAGEKLKFISSGTMNRTVFNMIYQPCEVEEISDNFYRIRPLELPVPDKVKKLPRASEPLPPSLDFHPSMSEANG